MMREFFRLALLNKSKIVPLRTWVWRNLGLPLAALVVGLFLVLIISTREVIRRNEDSRQRFFQSVALISDLAVRKREIEILESTLVLGMRQSEATWAAICRDDLPVIQHPALYESCKLKPQFAKSIRRIPLAGSAGASIVFLIPSSWVTWDVLRAPLLLLVFAFFSWCLIWFSMRRFRQNLLVPLDQGLPDSTELNILELQNLRSSLANALELERSRAAQEAKTRVMQQVAHDIRSPLAALGILERNLGGVSPDIRELARSALDRIRGIAEDLMSQGERAISSAASSVSSVHPSVTQNDQFRPVWMVVESALLEKRIVHREDADLKFRLNFDPDQLSTFVALDNFELSRVLSNLLNNSIDATQKKGKVNVWVGKDEDSAKRVLIQISDNGVGMSPEILRRLGSRGFSSGKERNESGYGLGVWHAQETVSAAGGSLVYESELGKGTRVTLAMPIAPKPDWFCDSISLSNAKRVVVVDDDPSVLELWEIRWRSFGKTLSRELPEKRAYLNVRSFVADLETWLDRNGFVFLIDHDFAGTSVNGLMLIEEYQLGERAILVTSRAFEKAIQEEALRLGCRVLPKSMISNVLIH
jgi:signal transduction histidine kinase